MWCPSTTSPTTFRLDAPLGGGAPDPTLLQQPAATRVIVAFVGNEVLGALVETSSGTWGRGAPGRHRVAPLVACSYGASPPSRQSRAGGPSRHSRGVPCSSILLDFV